MKPKIFVIGDSFIDEYNYCIYVKENPEAEGSVYRIDRQQYFLGGAAAVANMCSSLDCQVELATAIGDDIWQCRFRALLQDANVIWYPEVVFNYPCKTIVKSRMVVDDELYPNRFDIEQVHLIRNDLIFDMILKRIEKADVTLIADYGKGMISSYLLDKLPRDKTILVDPSIGRSWGDYHGCCIIKANEREARYELMNQHINVRGKKQADLLSDFYDRSVIITRGEAGLDWAQHNQTATTREHSNGTVPAIFTEKKDICGAGDTIFAALGVYLARGYSLAEACEIAVYHASQQIQSFGIRPLTEKNYAHETKTV